MTPASSLNTVARPTPHIVPAQIVEMHPEADFGCLRTDDGRMLYFHRQSVAVPGFDRLHRGDIVGFIERADDPGLHASRVYPVI